MFWPFEPRSTTMEVVFNNKVLLHNLSDIDHCVQRSTHLASAPSRHSASDFTSLSLAYLCTRSVQEKGDHRICMDPPVPRCLSWQGIDSGVMKGMSQRGLVVTNKPPWQRHASSIAISYNWYPKLLPATDMAPCL